MMHKNRNILIFVKFMTCVVARTDDVLVYSKIVNEVGVDEKTISIWFDILVRRVDMKCQE